jgi:signal peptidase II
MIVRWPRPLFYAMTVLALILDQVTKAWATASLQPVETVTLIPGFFNLTYVRNHGIAFGMFAGHSLLVGIFVVGLIVLGLFYARSVNWAGIEPNLIGGFLCGGALGNLLDRVKQGWVVDFFDVHIYSYRWPVFNVADSLICIAVGWIVLSQLRTK